LRDKLFIQEIIIVMVLLIMRLGFGECAEDILLGLKDVDWVVLRDLKEAVHLPKEKTQMLLDFISSSRSITVDDRTCQNQPLWKVLLRIQSPNS